MQKAILTVIGRDKPGIIKAVSSKLFEYNINILDITQTVIDGYFTMVLITDITVLGDNFDNFREDMIALGKKIDQRITVQHEEIFTAMHGI